MLSDLRQKKRQKFDCGSGCVFLAPEPLGCVPPGEKGTLMVLSADRRQSKIIFRYIDAFLQVPLLKKMVTARLKESIELDNGVTISIHTSNFRSVRGSTLVGAICDELAFWMDENSANPDAEVLAALKPGMSTIPGALLLCVSSPYARRGALYTAYKENFGKPSDVLVWQGASLDMNPGLDPTFIAQAFEKDRASALAEYGAEFRTDVETFLAFETVAARVVSGRRELPYVPGKTYFAFTDPSGGVGDSYTLAIAHCERDVAVLDLLREVPAPLTPALVTAEFAAILRGYHCSEVQGDRYGGSWCGDEFSKYGISYKASEKPKSEIYLEFMPSLMSDKIELLDNRQLIKQLTGLERRTGRGRDSIDHAVGAHDDAANAAAGAIVRVMEVAITGVLGVNLFYQRIDQQIRLGMRNIFGELLYPKPKSEQKPAPVALTKPATVTINNYEAMKKAMVKACPNCQSTAVVLLGAFGNTHCNQCGSDFNLAGEVLRKPEEILVGQNCCSNPLPAKIGDMVRCISCGQVTAPPRLAAVSFKDLRRRRFNGFMLLNNDDRWRN